MRRRHYLLATSSVFGFAGCSSTSSDPTETAAKTETENTEQQTAGNTEEMTERQLSGHIRPAESPESPVKELSCEKGNFTRHPPMYDEGSVPWGDTGYVSLRIDGTAFEYGDTAQITLTNVSDRTLSLGLKYLYQIELLTEDGWQDVRGQTGDDEFQYVDMGTEAAPGQVFEWSLRLTEEGVVPDEKDFTVCPELVSGRYRFVYWTVTPVAVAFDLQK
ncbi:MULTISPECIES: hypothetical protein [unclassified Haloarcula]|uniref:hypothetical protein n=1 Tax=unclassified Haloarcula TaxID=2624677 RepID=UPI0007BC0F06|nr:MULTISPECIES: hypothetical protein [unclassified Haloarcula]KZX48229.1 hypothetical protein AV929_11075 [Haloarcula sp. K1]MUV49929.1 hypothetical protein [Haloarcula sp. CBA1122]